MRNAYYILVISTILTTSSCQKENDGISTTAPNKKNRDQHFDRQYEFLI